MRYTSCAQFIITTGRNIRLTECVRKCTLHFGRSDRKLRSSLNMIICLYYWAQATETTDYLRIMCNVITIHLSCMGRDQMKIDYSAFKHSSLGWLSCPGRTHVNLWIDNCLLLSVEWNKKIGRGGEKVSIWFEAKCKTWLVTCFCNFFPSRLLSE